MNSKKIIGTLLVIGFMIWTLWEQTTEHPRIWVQVIGVALFFFAMARLMQKTPSNTPKPALIVRSEQQTTEETEEITADYSITEVNKKP